MRTGWRSESEAAQIPLAAQTKLKASFWCSMKTRTAEYTATSQRLPHVPERAGQTPHSCSLDGWASARPKDKGAGQQQDARGHSHVSTAPCYKLRNCAEWNPKLDELICFWNSNVIVISDDTGALRDKGRLWRRHWSTNSSQRQARAKGQPEVINNKKCFQN